MDQKPIVLYLRIAGPPDERDERDDSHAIHDDFVCTLRKDAVAYSTVTKYARSAQFSGRKKSHLPKLQMWNAVLLMSQSS
jgi:hypothetical protein